MIKQLSLYLLTTAICLLHNFKCPLNYSQEFHKFIRIQFSPEDSLAGGAGKLMITISASCDWVLMDWLRRTAVCMRINLPSGLLSETYMQQ